MDANLPSPAVLTCEECKQQECVCPKNRITRGRWHLDWYNQWPGILKPSEHNWSDWRFVFLAIHGEESPYKCSRELELGLLGFSIVITYCWYERESNDDC